MEVCILPISGGGFPIQISSCCILADVDYVPELVFASSGGAICAFLMMAADWKSRKVPLILENISSDLFLDKWKFPVLRNLYSVCQGSRFKASTAGEKLFHSLFDSRKISTIETWVGAFNKDERRLSIITNMSQETCKMELNWADVALHNLCHLKYMNGDVKGMASFVSASCSIPGMVPHKDIGAVKYVDGGVVSASPLAFFKHSLVALTSKKGKGDSIHFVCSTCEDLNSSTSCSYETISDRNDSGGTQPRHVGCAARKCYDTTLEEGGGGGKHIIHRLLDTVTSMINVSLVRDRMACNDVISLLGASLLGTVILRASHENMCRLKAFKESRRKAGTIVELFSNCPGDYMDLTNFTGEDCLKHKANAEKTMYCRLWVYYLNADDKINMLKSGEFVSLLANICSHDLQGVA